MLFAWTVIVEPVRACRTWGLFFLCWKILFPNLLAFNLLVIHSIHLALKFAATVLDVQDLAALQSFLIAKHYVNHVDPNWNPQDQQANQDDLDADVVENIETFVVGLLIVELFIYLFVLNGLTLFDYFGLTFE